MPCVPLTDGPMGPGWFGGCLPSLQDQILNCLSERSRICCVLPKVLVTLSSAPLKKHLPRVRVEVTDNSWAGVRAPVLPCFNSQKGYKSNAGLVYLYASWCLAVAARLVAKRQRNAWWGLAVAHSIGALPAVQTFDASYYLSSRFVHSGRCTCHHSDCSSCSKLHRTTDDSFQAQTSLHCQLVAL